MELHVGVAVTVLHADNDLLARLNAGQHRHCGAVVQYALVCPAGIPLLRLEKLVVEVKVLNPAFAQLPALDGNLHQQSVQKIGGVEAVLNSSSVWHTLHRRAFLKENGIVFIPGNVCEDLPFTYECYFKAVKCLKTNLRLNIYRRWNGSLTKNFNMRYAKDLCVAIGKTWALGKQSALTPEEYKGLQRILFVPFNFVTTSAIKHFPHLSDRLKVMDDLAKNAPDLQFSDGMYQKIISLI